MTEKSFATEAQMNALFPNKDLASDGNESGKNDSVVIPKLSKKQELSKAELGAPTSGPVDQTPMYLEPEEFMEKRNPGVLDPIKKIADIATITTAVRSDQRKGIQRTPEPGSVKKIPTPEELGLTQDEIDNPVQ